MSIFITNRFFDESIYAVVFSVSLWWSIFGYKYFEYWVLKRKNYKATLLYRKKIIPYIEYGGFKVLSKAAESITFAPWFLGIYFIEMLMLFFYVRNMSEFICMNQYLLFGCVGLFFHWKDAINCFKIFVKHNSHLYVEFKKEDVVFSEDTGINYKYSDILFYKEIYREMSEDDLKNELILINQQIDDRGKLSFVQICLIPAILAIVGGIFSVISTMLAYDLDNSQDATGTMLEYIGLIIAFIIATLVILFLINELFVPQKKNLLMKKTIIEECIKSLD